MDIADIPMVRGFVDPAGRARSVQRSRAVVVALIDHDGGGIRVENF